MPDAIATAGRVHEAAAADLEQIVGDIARWVAHESPSGATPELDLLAGELAATLTGYGMATELVPSPAGLHVHAVAHGHRAARGSRCCATTTRSSRSARSHAGRCGARAIACSAPAPPT